MVLKLLTLPRLHSSCNVKRVKGVKDYDTLSHHPSHFKNSVKQDSSFLLISSAGAMPTVHLLDYVAGNVLSLVNAIEKLGYTIEWIKTPEDVAKAEVSV